MYSTGLFFLCMNSSSLGGREGRGSLLGRGGGGGGVVLGSLLGSCGRAESVFEGRGGNDGAGEGSFIGRGGVLEGKGGTSVFDGKGGTSLCLTGRGGREGDCSFFDGKGGKSVPFDGSCTSLRPTEGAGPFEGNGGGFCDPSETRRAGNPGLSPAILVILDLPTSKLFL